MLNCAPPSTPRVTHHGVALLAQHVPLHCVGPAVRKKRLKHTPLKSTLRHLCPRPVPGADLHRCRTAMRHPTVAACATLPQLPTDQIKLKVQAKSANPINYLATSLSAPATHSGCWDRVSVGVHPIRIVRLHNKVNAGRNMYELQAVCSSLLFAHPERCEVWSKTASPRHISKVEPCGTSADLVSSARHLPARPPVGAAPFPSPSPAKTSVERCSQTCFVRARSLAWPRSPPPEHPPVDFRPLCRSTHGLSMTACHSSQGQLC